VANIYLRVPTYVAQWYRGRVAPEPPLTEFQAVEFSRFQEEYAMMESWLAFVTEQDMCHTACFSERMWKNMLQGKKPQGGKVLLKRDPKTWLTMDEINFLTGTKRNRKTDGFDYLCIAAPRVMVIGGCYKQVTGSFTLLFEQANALTRQLRREFLRFFLHWICEELFVCDRRGIRFDSKSGRDVVMCIEHFFYHYNMCLGTNATDRDSMRRMAKRWLWDAKMLPSDITDEEVLFFYEKEEQNRGKNIDELIEATRKERRIPRKKV
jgi:hypothetical protein